MKFNKIVRKKFVGDWNRGAMTVHQLAAKYQVFPSTVVSWAKKEDLKMRRRGAVKMQAPSPSNLKLLSLCSEHSYSEVATMLGVSRQHVSQVARRWRHLFPPKPSAGARAEGVETPKVKRQPKNHVVCFRLNESEFNQLKRFRIGGECAPYQTARALVLSVIGALDDSA